MMQIEYDYRKKMAFRFKSFAVFIVILMMSLEYNARTNKDVISSGTECDCIKTEKII